MGSTTPCDYCQEGRHIRCRPPCACSVCGGKVSRARPKPILSSTRRRADDGVSEFSNDEELIREAVLSITGSVIDHARSYTVAKDHGPHCPTCGQPI